MFCTDGTGRGERDKRTDDAADTGGDQVHEGVLGVLGFDEDGGAFDDGVDGLKAGCFHRLAGFYHIR